MGGAEAGAIAALRSDAGCDEQRARALVKAVGEAAAAEALEVVAGFAQAVGSPLDRRVAMLDRIVRALAAAERLPTEFEVGAIFRITPAQGRNALRTYQARFSDNYRSRLSSALAAVAVKREQHEDVNVFVFDFDDPAVLEYAAERLRRRGLTRSVTIDRTRLEIIVARAETDRLGMAADAALQES